MTTQFQEVETAQKQIEQLPDTTVYAANDPNFQNTNNALVWRMDGMTVRGATKWNQIARIYKPTREAIEWDFSGDSGRLAQYDQGVLWAIGNRYGFFSYVVIEITGRDVSRIPSMDSRGIRCQATWNLDSQDEERGAAWMIEKYWN